MAPLAGQAAEPPVPALPAIQPIPVKVIVVANFEPGEDMGDAPGEFQLWAEREKLTEVIPIRGALHPLRRNAGMIRVLREVYGLTGAEASVAEALQAGTSLGDYARERRVSLNTVYTHLRHIKDKTGCKRLAELIRKLNDLQAPLRIG